MLCQVTDTFQVCLLGVCADQALGMHQGARVCGCEHTAPVVLLHNVTAPCHPSEPQVLP